MTPHQDACESLRLALQHAERAQKALAAHNLPWVGSELVLAKLSIEDAQSVLATDEVPE